MTVGDLGTRLIGFVIYSQPSPRAQVQFICTNLYALFSHVEKAYTANQNGVQLFHMWKYNQSTIA